MSRRIHIAAATALGATALAAAALTFAMAGSAIASSTAAAAGSRGTKIELRRTNMGKILVNSHGFTLYAFGRDGRNKDRCAALSGCPGTWPLVTTNGRPQAGRGVDRSLLGTIKVGRNTQVTYAGHPLYTYAFDTSGSTSYVGQMAFGGRWRALTASGKTKG